ncbi:hypothetical protein COU57_04820 [Candidatus Pacearchaeota archaeon CG10_big_fil_rev_8_21_14_0_10_32_14]|nr:MAG: hypothetical protein COU57_04820 [Candidatus Pacearchaeota archaeon CG10_big_fil_rev_8_21_14_0_10_32_14]
MAEKKTFHIRGKISGLVQRTTSTGDSTLFILNNSSDVKINSVKYQGSTALRVGDYISAQGNEIYTDGNLVVGQVNDLSRFSSSRSREVLEQYRIE